MGKSHDSSDPSVFAPVSGVSGIAVREDADDGDWVGGRGTGGISGSAGESPSVDDSGPGASAASAPRCSGPKRRLSMIATGSATSMAKSSRPLSTRSTMVCGEKRIPPSTSCPVCRICFQVEGRRCSRASGGAAGIHSFMA